MTEDDCGRIYCTILQGKSCLVSLKQITIPCLELSAATVSIQLDKILKRELELSLTDESTFWTDRFNGAETNNVELHSF